MAYPSEEYLKNLIERVNDLEQQLYDAHPTDDVVYTGVLGPVQDGDQFLTVYPYTPTVDSDGNLAWDDPKTFYDNLDDDAAYDKVYVTGLPATEYINCFGAFLVIKYWAYNGVGDDQDRIRGTYVIDMPQNMKFLVTAVDGTYPNVFYTGQRILYQDQSATDSSQWVTNSQDVPLVNGFEWSEDSFPYTDPAGYQITDDQGTIDGGSCVKKPFGVGAMVDVTLIVNNAGGFTYVWNLPNSGGPPPDTSSGG